MHRHILALSAAAALLVGTSVAGAKPSVALSHSLMAQANDPPAGTNSNSPGGSDAINNTSKDTSGSGIGAGANSGGSGENAMGVGSGSGASVGSGANGAAGAGGGGVGGASGAGAGGAGGR